MGVTMPMGFTTQWEKDGRWSLDTVNVTSVVTFGASGIPLLPLHVGCVLLFDVDVLGPNTTSGVMFCISIAPHLACLV